MTHPLFRYFYEISAIPRPSGKEEKIADYLEEFAKEHGLAVLRDAENNVLIRKSASAGFETAPSVLLQGHTDMVCEKNAGTIHDFDTEGIRIIEDGDYLRADGTTLGGDNGYAVAAMLSILADDSISHPALECLFTTGEEVGLDGMKAFDKSVLTSKMMINLDSEEEKIATVACAGGVRTDLTRKPIVAAVDGTVLRLTVSGLAGGHSGASIHLGLANALKVTARLLTAVKKVTTVQTIEMVGGNKDNAIPRECDVIFAAKDAAVAENAIKSEAERIRETLIGEDNAFNVKIEHVETDAPALSATDSDALLTLIRLLPCGVIRMSPNIAGLVETSSNTAIVRADASAIRVTASSRSSAEAELDDVMSVIDTAAAVTGFETNHHSRYPGWAFTPNSRLQPLYLETYRELFGTDAKIAGIHAGLECGLVKEVIPEMDIISIGPNMYDIHTPDEKLSISSSIRVYDLLVHLLAKLK